MNKIIAIILSLLSLMQTACISTIWTGATMVYDRHNIYKQVGDYQLTANLLDALFKDKILKQPGCSLDLAVFNGDVLLAGHLPDQDMREMAIKRVNRVGGYRRFFNQITIHAPNYTSIGDSWITARIRARILADSAIDPHVFKVLTSDRIVYLMGDVKPEQAAKVISIASDTGGVVRVVKLFKYYNLSEKPEVNKDSE